MKAPFPRLARPRLDDATAAARVTLVLAPAGWGKTVVLDQWAGQAASREERLIRLSGLDDDAAVRAGLKAASARGAPTLLLLDDFHRFGAAAQEAARDLAERPSADLRIVIASRRRPALPVARLRVGGELAEIGIDQLRLTEDEAAELLSRLDLRFDPALALQLLDLAAGWPAALRLLAPLLGERIKKGGDLLERAARRHAPAAAYVREELLDPQLEPDRALLLATAPLGRFSPALARAAVDGAEVEAALEAFEDQGLLTREPESGWLAHHPLVALCLEAELRRRDAPRVLELHGRASEFCAREGRLNDAIGHAFAAQDADTAADLLVKASHVRNRAGRWREFTGWIANLPPGVADRWPTLQVEAAVSHASLFEIDAARAYLAAVHAGGGELTRFAREGLLAAEAIVATCADEIEGAMLAAERALRDGTPHDSAAEGAAKGALALGWINRGAADRARALLPEVRAAFRRSGGAFGTAMAIALGGLIELIEGRLASAVAAWEEWPIEGLGLHPPMAEAVARSYLPFGLYELNRLDRADAELRQAARRSGELILPDMAITLYLTAARIAFARGRDAEWRRTLDEAEVTGRRRDWPRLVQAAGWERVHFALRQGDLVEARRLRGRLGIEANEGPRGMETDLHAIGALRFDAVTRPDRAILSTLRSAITAAKAQNRICRMVRLMVIEAAARHAQGDPAGALRALRRALEAAEPGGLIRVFLDEGAVIPTLVRRLAQEEQAVPLSLDPAYLARILEAAGDSLGPAGAAGETGEALTRREEEILRLVSAGLSNREIAGRLFVTENTVKWHLQHVFAKLGVRTRTRALLAARDLDLIGDVSAATRSTPRRGPAGA